MTKILKFNSFKRVINRKSHPHSVTKEEKAYVNLGQQQYGLYPLDNDNQQCICVIDAIILKYSSDALANSIYGSSSFEKENVR